VNLYLQDTASLTGPRLVPKLKYEHVYLTSFSKLRVDLAAQVYIYISILCVVITQGSNSLVLIYF